MQKRRRAPGLTPGAEIAGGAQSHSAFHLAAVADSVMGAELSCRRFAGEVR